MSSPLRVLALALIGILTPAILPAQSMFKRGDVNGDGCIGLLDVDRLMNYLFAGGTALDCFDAADANDDGMVNQQDVIHLVNFVSQPGTPPPSPPGPTTCGPDPTPDALPCVTYTACAPCSPSTCESFNSGGTAVLPPPCGYVTPAQVHMIIDGLPPGTTVEIGIVHGGFAGTIVTPGGALGGNIETFDSTISMQMTGTGALAGFSRSLTVNAPVEIHTGPPQPGMPVQDFPTQMAMLEGLIVGDPDFDLLHITAGSGFGLPSPGHTTLTNVTSPGNPGTIWQVDSFFDITYRIEFVGSPGGPLAGMSGITTSNTFVGTPGATPPPIVEFRRGDANIDSLFDIADAIQSLGILFSGIPSLCDDAVDANDDGAMDIGDPIYALGGLFSGGPLPPAPGPVMCGPDPTGDPLDCDMHPCP